MIAIGSIWKRRVTPATPDGWDRIRVTGVFAQRETAEVIVRQADCFGPVLSVPQGELEVAFTLEVAAPAQVPVDIADTGGAWL